MPRKAIRIELNKLSTELINRALDFYHSEYKNTYEFNDTEEKEMTRLINRFVQHLKSFEDNL